MAQTLDEQVALAQPPALDAGPYPFLWVDALTQRVHEDGRTLNVHALLAVGVTSSRRREVLGVDVVSSEGGCGLAFLRDLRSTGSAGYAAAVASLGHGDGMLFARQR